MLWQSHFCKNSGNASVLTICHLYDQFQWIQRVLDSVETYWEGWRDWFQTKNGWRDWFQAKNTGEAFLLSTCGHGPRFPHSRPDRGSPCSLLASTFLSCWVEHWAALRAWQSRSHFLQYPLEVTVYQQYFPAPGTHPSYYVVNLYLDYSPPASNSVKTVFFCSEEAALPWRLWSPTLPTWQNLGTFVNSKRQLWSACGGSPEGMDLWGRVTLNRVVPGGNKREIRPRVCFLPASWFVMVWPAGVASRTVSKTSAFLLSCLCRCLVTVGTTVSALVPDPKPAETKVHENRLPSSARKEKDYRNRCCKLGTQNTCCTDWWTATPHSQSADSWLPP